MIVRKESRAYYATLLSSLFLVCLLLMAGSATAHANWYDGDDLGYLDLVTVNGTGYEDLDAHEVVFYAEDLEANNGEVEITGILESEQKDLKPSDLKVQVSLNGGKSWHDATGDSRWSYTFRPTLERYYDLTIQVVRRDSGLEFFDDVPLGTSSTGDQLTPYQLGAFVLASGATVLDNKLTGEATLALGWLAQFVPENLKKPGTDELLLMVQDLQVEGEAIVNGSVVFEPDFSFTYAGANFTFTNLTLTKDGASATGSMTLPSVILPSAPAITFSDLNFSPTAINYTLPLVTTTDPVQNFEIISGNYGVSLALSDLSVKINTGAEIPISLASLDGSILLGSGYGGMSIPNLRLLENQLLSYGTAVVAQGTAEAQTALAKLTIPGTEFSLGNLGGSINLADKSVSISGSFDFPDSLGGGSVFLPADKPLTLSTRGISTTGTLTFDVGTLPPLDLSGFPTSLTGLDLNILNNIPSGALAGSVTLTNFANVKLDVEADLDTSGLSGLRLAAIPAGGTRTLDIGGFATLSLSKAILTYENSSFEVELDGSITPTNDLLTSINGMGDQLVFTGLSISKDAIALASDLEGWHDITGASAGFEGATVQLNQYGLGVDDNLFWVGLKGQASIGGSSAVATAKIFHDGSTAIEGIDLTNIYFALGDFFLKVASDEIGEAGAIANNTQGAIGGLPQILIDELPAGVLNDANELVVQLQNFKVDVANRSVSLGSVGYTPTSPLDVTLGPATLTFAGIIFTTSSASIDGSISLTGLGLPVSDLPFADLYLGRDGVAGEIDLIGDAGSRTITIMDGDYGFSLKLADLTVNVDTRKELAKMVSLESFGGSVLFGSGFNDLEIPDLELLASNAISWGKNTATEAQGSLARLTLPGGVFSLGDLGGSLNLDAQSLSIAGTIYLPPSMGSASLTIPADKPLTLSVSDGLSTSGPLVFDPADLPAIPLASIDSTLTALSLDLSGGNISGSLAGDLNFSQFGGLQIAVSAGIDKTGLQDLKIDTGNLAESFDLAGFAKLGLTRVVTGYKNENFYVEIDGGITPTHDLFADYGKQVDFSGLRIFKTGIEFASDVDGWHETAGATVTVNAAQLTLKEYGLGVYEGALWFGLKGQATYLDNEINLTAKIFQDGTYEISDFGFEGLYLALGDFSLRTSAEAIAGKISGAGSINAGFLSDYLPDNIKDPLTGEVNVEFADLGVDLENRTITSGTVMLKFKQPLTPDLGIFSAVIRSVSFGFDGGSVDGDFSLTKLADIDIPSPPTGISFADIELVPAGFIGTASYQAGRNPVNIPVLTGEYGIDLLLSELTVAVDTTEADLLDKIRLTDLDGAIELGSGYDMREPVTQLRMLADDGITWGAASLAGLSEEAQREAERLQSSLSFTIPGTSFQVDKLNGRLYLNDKKMEVWGQVKLPADLGGVAITVAQANALVLSVSGVSTTGELDVDLGTLGSGFKLAGFGADLTAFSFGVTANTVSGSIAGDIKLDMFDNLPIGVSVALGNAGISELTVTADEIGESFTIADFATLTLSSIGGGYEDGAFFVDLDGNLALENAAIGDLPQSFDFRELRIYHDALALADAALGMHDIPGATITLNDSLAMFLSQYGIGVTDNRFWIALAGGVTVADQEVTATAKLYHDGEFELVDFGADNLTLAIGDFTLRSSIAFSNEAGFEAEGGLHLGALMDSIPADLKNPFGELPVTIRDVVFDLTDLSNPKLVSGAIVFAPGTPIPLNTEFFSASVTGFEVGMTGGSPYGKVMGGTISFNAVGVLPALDGVSITNLGLAGGGLQGTVTWSGSQTVHVFEDDLYGIDAALTTISIIFDSTQSSLEDMFILGDLGGSLVFGEGYDTSMAPAIDFVDGAYGFAAGEVSKLTLPGTGVDLRNVSGSFDFEARTVTVGGLIAIPYEETEIAFDVDELTFSASGIAGSAALDSDVDLSETLGFSALLTEAAIAFDGFAISEGSLGMDLTLEKFFDLDLTAHLTLDNDGVSEWGLGGETDATFTADAGFADMTVSNLGAGYESADGGLYFSMDTDIAMNADAVLSALPDDLTLSGIEVFATSINIDGASMSESFEGQTASLGGLDLTLTKLGVGYGSEKFYLEAGGNINIANLCEAGAEIKLYEDLTYDLDAIEIAFTNPALSFDGYLAMYDNDPVYGTGFGAELDVVVAGTIPVSGALQVGRVDNDGRGAASFMYWRVEMKAGTMIPLAPIPLNIYGLGGGIAYHMQVNASPGSVDFTPSGSAGLALTALVDMGTTDNGSSWYGKFGLTLEPSDMRVTLVGESWIMEGRNPSGSPHLSALLELGGSPAVFHLAAWVNLSKEVGGMDMVAVNGDVDILFAANDWHVYFGSKQQPLSVTVLHYLGGEGYLQFDRSGLAMGVRKEFNLEGSAWIFYGRLYGGGEIDLEASIYPFYIDARGRVWIGLEAGVKSGSKKYSIISAYAELGGQFKAPPVYIGLHGEARYSFLMGAISGTWDMTFTYPENPPEGAGERGIESMPLVAYSLPENQATDIGRLNSLNIKTTMPIMEPFKYDDDQWYILCVRDNAIANSWVDFDNAQEAFARSFSLTKINGSTTSRKEVVGGRLGSMELQYTPVSALTRNSWYQYETAFDLRRYTYTIEGVGVIGGVVNSESVRSSFVAADAELSFRERVYEVYPTRTTAPVYEDTSIYLITKAIFDGTVWTWAMHRDVMEFQVLNTIDEVMPGRIEGNMVTTDNEEGSRRYLVQFIPDAPLKPVRMVENTVTGIKLPAVQLADGSYQNPFTYTEPEESGGSVVTVQGAATTAQPVNVTASSRVGVVSLGTSAVRQQATVPRVTGGRTGVAVDKGDETEADVFQATVVGDLTLASYKWYWDGEYRIQIMQGDERKYTSKFNLVTPAPGQDSNAFASTSDVLSQSVSEPYFYINYTVNQDAYQDDIGVARNDILHDGVSDIFWENMNRTPLRTPLHSIDGTVQWVEMPVCGQFDSPHDLAGVEGGEAAAMYSASWSDVRMIPKKLQWWLYSLALQGCAGPEAEIAAVTQQFEAYKEAAFSRHSVAEFRSLEFRFSTDAPINWSEVELEVIVEPRFDGRISTGQDDVIMQAIRNVSSHRFGTGEYIVRSQENSLNHRIELSAEDRDAFMGGTFVTYIQAYFDQGFSLTSLGSVSMYERGLEETETSEGEDEFSVERGDALHFTGNITDVRTSRPASNSAIGEQ